MLRFLEDEMLNNFKQILRDSLAFGPQKNQGK